MSDNFLNDLDSQEESTKERERRSVLGKITEDESSVSSDESNLTVPVIDSSLKLMLSGRISQKKSLVSYKLDDDVIELINNNSKHISKSVGGKSAFVNNLLIDALKMHGYWKE